MAKAELVTVGRVLAVYGVKGWVKIYSHTQPMDGIFRYQPCYLLKKRQAPQLLQLSQGKRHGKGLIAHFQGIDDRDVAQQQLVGHDLAVPADVLPQSGGDTWYWRDLIGLRVINQADEDLGVVQRMLETGANDVMQLQGDAQSVDQQQRLLPWLPDQIVIDVDLQGGIIRVDWDADF